MQQFLFKLVLSLVASIGLSAPVAWGSVDTLRLNPKRTVEVIDVMDGSVFGLAQKVYDLSRKAPTEPIYILLNSPGGAVVPGYTLVDSIEYARARGTPIICVAGVLAASMAFNVLASCDERYALAHTKLLFHPIRINGGGGLTSRELSLYGDQLHQYDERNSKQLREMMGVGAAWFSKHYWGETLWDAQDLLAMSGKPWLTIVTNVEGTDKLFTFEKPNPLRDLFGGQLKAAPRIGDYPVKLINREVY